MEKENLLGVLIEAGIGSRRSLAAAIMQGKVTVNGLRASNLRQPVDSEKDTIAMDGKIIGIKQKKHVYLILNKPEGVVSTLSDERGRKTVIEFIPERYRSLRLYPAGRLDIDTTGLLLLTNDGEFTNRITHPRFENEKEYLIKIGSMLKHDDVVSLEQGIEIDGDITAPAKVKPVKNVPPYNYSITIHEGRKRQVRRMFLSIGYRPLALKRVRIGKLTLGDLKEGEVRELREDEIKRLISN